MPLSRFLLVSDAKTVAAAIALDTALLGLVSVNSEQESVIHITTGMSEIVVENAVLEVLFFGQQRQGPHAPEEVVKERTVKYLLLEGAEHLRAKVLVAGELLFELLRHIPLEIPVKVHLDETVHFGRVHDVVEVPLHAVRSWVRVIVHSFVDIDGQVHCHRVPASILIVDDDDVAVVDD